MMIKAAAIYVFLGLMISVLAAGCSDNGGDTVAPDTAPPEITATYPTEGAADVAVDIVIAASFSEEMDRWGFSEESFVVSGGVTGALQYGNKTISLTPSEPLAYEQEYTVVITDSVRDLAGNNIDSNYSWSFTTMPEPIMPLGIGHNWEFVKEVFDTAAGTSQSSIEVWKIIGDTLIQSEKWYVDTTGKIYTNRDDGLWSRSLSGQAYLFLKYPAALNETYASNPDMNESIEVTGTSTVIGVPHGFHICYRYRATFVSGDHIYVHYYKPGLGPVMIEKRSLPDYEILERLSLKKYQLK